MYSGGHARKRLCVEGSPRVPIIYIYIMCDCVAGCTPVCISAIYGVCCAKCLITFIIGRFNSVNFFLSLVKKHRAYTRDKKNSLNIRVVTFIIFFYLALILTQLFYITIIKQLTKDITMGAISINYNKNIKC